MPQFDFIEAAYGRPHSRLPIWIMRQAGRYLPEYRAIREKVSFTELCRSPQLIAKVTKVPVDIFGMDAAILFSDILLPLEPMGIKVDYDNGGPVLSPVVKNPADFGQFEWYDPSDEMKYVLAGIRETKKRLGDVAPLIGFCGSPFTLACYIIEGGGSWRFSEIKKFLYNFPKETTRLLSYLAELSGRYLKAQIIAGADAVQVFDSWGGILPPDLYREFSLAHIKTIFEICKTENIPRILYLNNSAPYLKLLAEIDCEVVSVDWRTELNEAMTILDGKTVQGNLDPHALFGSPESVFKRAVEILDSVAGKDNFIFNLGHGILPETPVESVKMLVNTVHSFRREENPAATKPLKP
jgi:uroporphyrinogen decarboxylase